MVDIKSIIAKNISELRQAGNMTQLELAEKLNYSDKTISKWERAESSPDISVLMEIAALFGVTLDYLVQAEHPAPEKKVPEEDLSEDAVVPEEAVPPATAEEEEANTAQMTAYNRRAIAYVSECGCWIAAIFAFIITTLILGELTFQFLYFVYTLPVVLIVKLVFNSVWFNPRRNYLIISILMWSILASIRVTFAYFGVNVALIYLLGAAGQIVIVLCSFIHKPKK